MIQKIVLLIFSLFSLLFSRFSFKEPSLSDHFSNKLKTETQTLGSTELTFATSDTQTCVPKEDPYDENASPLVLVKDQKTGKLLSNYSVAMRTRFPTATGMYDENHLGNEVHFTNSKLHNIDDDPEKEVTATWFASGCGSGGITGMAIFDLQKDNIKILGGYPLLDEKDDSKVILRETKTNQELAFQVIHTYDTMQEWKDLNNDGKDELLVATFLGDPKVEECHLCAHRWELSVYEWKEGKFVPAEEWRGGNSFQTIEKFGWSFDVLLPTYEFFTKRTNSPPLASHFEKAGKYGYVHPVYQYSFLYLKDWNISEVVEGGLYDYVNIRPIWDTSITDGGITITAYPPIPSPLSTKEYLAQWMKEGKDLLKKPVTWREVLNGREWYFIHDVGSNDPYAALFAFTSHNGYVYSLSVNPDPMMKQDWPAYEQARSKILAGFRQIVANFKPETTEKKKNEVEVGDPFTLYPSPTDPKTVLMISREDVLVNKVYLDISDKRKFVAQVANPYDIRWSPDGKYVAMTDHILSNEEETYTIDVVRGYMHATLAPQEYLKLQKNPESFDHLYVQNVKWLSNDKLQVKVVGHSDTVQGQVKFFTIDAGTGIILNN